MLTGNFQLIHVDDIVVKPGRQRQSFDEDFIASLADSIRDNGLINPIVVTRDYELVAGECRLRAHQLLGADMIKAQFAEDLTEREAQILELEENVRRSDLHWLEHSKAVARYHALQVAEHRGKWAATSTAKELGISPRTLDSHLMVVRNLNLDLVREAPAFSTAVGAAARHEARAKDSAIAEFSAELSDVIAPVEATSTVSGQIAMPASEGTPAPVEESSRLEIITGSFLDWAETQHKPYNFIHCDFPYGIGIGAKVGQGAAKSHGGYEDTAEIYFELLDTLINKADNFIAPSAHMIFWLSMKYYEQTKERLEAAGWRVFVPPLIWLKQIGVIPDANRGPRNVTEFALFCSRGDRKIVRVVHNAVAEAATKEYHQSEKPLKVLQHFFRMVVDEHSRVLDPTCGSGMAVKVAGLLGAQEALGIELDPEFAARARQNVFGVYECPH